MAKTKINPADVINSSSKASSAQSAVSGVVSGIYSTRWMIDSQILNRNGIGASLGTLQGQIAQLEQDIRKISQTVENGASQYQATENWVVNLGRTVGGINGKSGTEDNKGIYEAYFSTGKIDAAGDTKPSISDEKMQVLYEKLEKGEQLDDEELFRILGAEFSNDAKPFGKISATTFLAALSANGAKQYWDKFEASVESSLEGSAAMENLLKILGDKNKNMKEWLDKNDFFGDRDKWYKQNELRREEKKESYFDKDGNEIKDCDTKFYDREVELFEIKGEEKISAGLWAGEVSVGNNGKVSAEVGTAEAHASISGGLYVIGDDGDRHFSPGVAAEVGASVTAASVEWEQQWFGDENFGLNTEINATAGKVEAKAEGCAQVFDENGKLAVQLGASASAEAIALEAEGKVAVNVLGGEVGVKGGVNIGVGAHADVGYRDGVFKCDVGASLGIGVSVDLEVDVGGMVNTVVDKASSIWNDVQSIWNS